MAEERIQKILARAGLGSRRGCEVLLTTGRVTVDGRRAQLGERADPQRQRIAVDGRAIALPAAQDAAVWLLHKPAGYVVTTRDELGRPTIYDLLPDAPPSLRYAGRLDRDSEGLLLLTTDGELANRIAHPRYRLDRVYDALLDRPPGEADLRALHHGVVLEDGPARAVRVEQLDRRLVRLTLREGRKREVRRMFAARGLAVERLVRRRLGPVTLGALPSGTARPLAADEISALRRAVGLPAERGDLDAAREPFLSSPDSSPTRTDRSRRTAAQEPPVPDAADAPLVVPDPTASAGAIGACIALDGPTASGKSVVGRALAEALGLGFFDTGLMYRACTLAVLRAGIDPNRAEQVVALVRALDLDVSWPDPAIPRVRLDGADVTAELREPEVERHVSLVSGLPEVRTELVRRQRAIAAREPVVMAGRDIGTRVLVEARTKIFLDASTEVRARRRLGEELERGRDTTFERVLAETRRRDELDATGHRAIRREQAAPDALIVDTDAVGIDQVVETCIATYRAHHPGGEQPDPA